MLLSRVGTYQGAELGFATIADGLAVVEQGGYLRLLFAARDDARLGAMLLGDAEAQAAPISGFPVMAGGGSDLACQEIAATRRVFVFSGPDGMVRQTVLSATGVPGKQTVIPLAEGILVDVAAMEVVERGAIDLAITASEGRSGLMLFHLSDAGSFTPAGAVADGPKTCLSGISDLASLVIGPRSFVLVASALEDGLTVLELGEGGQATPVDTLSAANGLPINGPQALMTVSTAGQHYVLVASTLSSSLTMVRVTPEGVLFEASHLIDDRTTQFDGVAALAGFAWNGRSFAVAAGSDAGVTLVELCPDGGQSPIASLSLETVQGMTAITGLAAAVTGGKALIFLADSTGTRIHRIEVDLASVGGLLRPEAGLALGGGLDERLWGGAADETLAGGGGDDHLHDGAGADLMSGGAGADVFVLNRDSAADRIADFQPGLDRIDLGDWGRIYSAAGLSISPTATGAIINYGAESLTVTSASGGRLFLTDADFLF